MTGRGVIKVSIETNYVPASVVVKSIPELVQEALVLLAKGRQYMEVRNQEAAHRMCEQALQRGRPPLLLRQLVPHLVNVRVKSLLERAAVYLQFGWLLSCILDCSSSIAGNVEPTMQIGEEEQLESWHDFALLFKALLLRATAWEALGFPSRARADLNLVCRCGLTNQDDPAAVDATAVAEASLQRLDREVVESRRVVRLQEGWCWDSLSGSSQSRAAACLPLAAMARLRLLNRQLCQTFSRSLVWETSLTAILGPCAAGAIGGFEHTFRPSPEQSPAISTAEAASGLWGFRPTREYCLVELTLQEHSAQSRVELARSTQVWRWLPRLLRTCPAIVMDVGQAYTKIGLAGSSCPANFISNFLAVGTAHVLDNGTFVEDPDLLKNFFAHAVFDTLGVDPRNHTVVVAESSWQQDEAAEMEQYDDKVTLVAQCLREEGVPLVCRAHSAVLALVGHRRQTGLVLDLGMAVTRAVPVINGQVYRSGIRTVVLGGANATNYMGKRLGGELTGIDSLTGLHVTQGVKEECGFVASSREETERTPPEEVPLLTRVLHHTVELGFERAMVGEMFFSPDCTGPQDSYFGPGTPQPQVGVHQLVLQAVAACPAEQRPTLLASVVLAGGSGAFRGMRERLQAELTQLCRTEGDKLGLAGCVPQVLPFRPEPVWFGGSVVGTMLASCEADLARLRGSCEEDEDEGGGDYVAMALGRHFWSMYSETAQE